MRKSVIYIIKNTCNDKVYIGQTKQAVEERFRQHLKPSTFKKRGTYKIYNAMAKYGKENFYYEVLEKNIEECDVDKKEIFYISKYDSFKNGYNSTNGGDSKTICKVTDLEKLKELSEKGISYKEIAKEFGVNKATIQRTLHSMGIKKNNIVSKEYLIKNKETKTNIQMADELGVSTATISRAFKKFGIPRGTGSTNHLNPQNKKRK